MRETRLSGSEGGAGQLNAPSLPLSSSPWHRSEALVAESITRPRRLWTPCTTLSAVPAPCAFGGHPNGSCGPPKTSPGRGEAGG